MILPIARRGLANHNGAGALRHKGDLFVRSTPAKRVGTIFHVAQQRPSLDRYELSKTTDRGARDELNVVGKCVRATARTR